MKRNSPKEKKERKSLENHKEFPEFADLKKLSGDEFLSLSNRGITSLKGFPDLPKLKKLDLSSNNISDTLNFLKCSNLTHLNLSNNKIEDIDALKPLAAFNNLQSLILVNCKVSEVADYRKKVFGLITSLLDLDGESKKAIDQDAVPVKCEDSVIPVKCEDSVIPVKCEDSVIPVKCEDSVIPDKCEDSEKMDTDEGNSEMQKNDAEGNNSVVGKRPIKDGDSSARKKRKTSSSVHQKNALMQLNELKPGLQYAIESQSGPPHNPEFVVSVEVNGQKYTGQGNSKQLAKHAAARAALSSFVQFRNMPEAMTAMSKPSNVSDFTADSVENDECSFNKFEIHKNGAEREVIISSGAPTVKKSLKVLTEADKKNPVMLLNEIHPGLSYTLVEENSTVPSQRFRMTVEVSGQIYEGTGQNKKQAKASAARAVLTNLYNVSYSMFAPGVFVPETPADAELFKFPQAVADKISKLLMSTFTDVMTGNPESAKWKVIAGIAMTKDESMEDIQIIGIGTGTKCISGEHMSMVGACLNDCHAEIISRRCLKDFLYTNLELHLEGEGEQSIFIKREGSGFCLKPHVKFHLYISTAPCGDARIFSPHEEGVVDLVDRHPNRNSRGVLRSKIESGEGTIPIKPGQCIQTWDGILPGQERLLTMSCSDKIASWNATGLQGALLSHFIEPIYLDSVILGGLFHPNHLRRALFGRIEGTLKDLPPGFKLNRPKMCVTTSPERRHLAKSPNFSVNWTVGLGRAEVINVSVGKTENGQVSRLAKRSFFQRFMNIYDRLPRINQYENPQPALYAAFKRVVKNYQEAKKALIAGFVDAGLGNWAKRPMEENEFEL